MKSDKFSIIASLVLCATSTAFAAETPDFSKESRFYKIYKNFNEQPTSDETWNKAVGERKAEQYQVQKGDTLSGLSATLFGDPFFWPKIWSLNNQQILNPHEIEPGMSVRFYPGSAGEAPTMQLAGAGEVAPINLEAPKGPDVPVAKKKRAAPLRALPDSLPQRSVGVGTMAKAEFLLEPLKHPYGGSKEFLSYYVSDSSIVGQGVVTGIELDLPAAGEFQYIYVRIDGTAEKFYTAQKNKISLPGNHNKSQKANMVEIQGQVEILESVNSGKNIYRAIVKKLIHPVEVGSLLVPGSIPTYSPEGGEHSSIANLRVIGGQFDEKRQFFGSASLVFLDGGASQGLRVGQLLNIYANEQLRANKTEALENDRKIATVKVVQTSSDFCTVFVLKSSEDILVGDHTGVSDGHNPIAIEPTKPSEPSTALPGKTSASAAEEELLDIEEVPASDSVEPDGGTQDGELEL